LEARLKILDDERQQVRLQQDDIENQKREPATRFTLERTPFHLSRVFLCTDSKNELLGSIRTHAKQVG